MSIFSSQSSWPAGCSSANQSPINLTESQTKPCNLSCDLVMDDGHVTQAVVSISDEGLVLTNTSSLGSCKFRGESYVCQAVHITHPSQHTVEGVQADGEVVAMMRKPTGELFCISVLFRVSPSQTESYSFFKQFVPYALTSGDTQVTMRDWNLGMMIPPAADYFVYSGSTVVPPCTSCEWVVFKTMINMDTTDFAYLVRNVQAGSRSVQAVGNRDVFFNNTQNVPGSMPHDGKFYLKLKAGPAQRKKHKVNKVDLKTSEAQSREDAEEERKHPTSASGKAKKSITDAVDANGGLIESIEFLLAIVMVGLGLYLGYTRGSETPFKTDFAKRFAVWIRSWFIKTPPIVV